MIVDIRRVLDTWIFDGQMQDRKVLQDIGEVNEKCLEGQPKYLPDTDL